MAGFQLAPFSPQAFDDDDFGYASDPRNPSVTRISSSCDQTAFWKGFTEACLCTPGAIELYCVSK